MEGVGKQGTETVPASSGVREWSVSDFWKPEWF